MGHLRIAAPFQQLGIRVILGVENGRVQIDRVSEGEVVIFQREFPGRFDEYQEIIRLARCEGKPIVFDLDDLLFFLPEIHPDRLIQYYAPSLLPMLQAVMEADLVTVSTSKLQDILAHYNPKIAVLHNYLDDQIWRLNSPVKDASGRPLVIGYMGTNSHKPDLDYIAPVLIDLIKRYPQRIRFHCWGVQPPAELLSLSQVEWTPPPSLSYKEFVAFFQTQSADIFVAPLLDNLFNRCKSPLKFFEYSAIGAPGVYSHIETYTGLVTHGENGLLATSLKEWEGCLVQLIEDDELRFRLATNAQATIRANWFLSQNVFRWREVFENLVSESSHQVQCQNLLVQAINSQLFETFTWKGVEIQTLTAQLTEKEQAVQSLVAQVAEKEQAIQSLVAQVAEKEQAIQSLVAQVAEKEHVLSEIYRSKAWRLVTTLRRIRMVLAPLGSRWARIGGHVIALVFFPFTIRRAYELRRDLALMRYSPLFDRDWYLAHNPDVARSGMDPACHYIRFGGFEGRDPSPYFASSWYLENYRDVKAAEINPLIHYLRYGKWEGRLPKPPELSAQSSNRWMTDVAMPHRAARSQDRWYDLRYRIYIMGRAVFRRVSPRFRHKILYWLYRNVGFLFREMPHYENWRTGRVYGENGTSWQHYLIEIDAVPPARVVEGRIAIHLHIFYHDLVKEFAEYLRNMLFPYDLYVSVSTDEMVKICQREFLGLPFCNRVRIECVTNRGRDVAPMFSTFGKVLAGYDYVAHLHSKKSLYNEGNTEGWRQYSCKSLLGSAERIRQIFGLMQDDPTVGLVYPQNYVLLPYWANTWLANRTLGEMWCRRLGIRDIPRGYFDYPAGSMFWARGDALAPLFDAGITLADFPEETGQTDGTLAHTLERLFVLCTLRQGMRPAILRDSDFPSWSSWRFEQYIGRSYESIAQTLASPDIKLIVFDVFDTLLCRPLLDPETIKTIVARRIGGELGSEYMEYRTLAEQQARAARGADVGLDEIYVRLGELTGFARECLAELRRMEETTERASLEPRLQAHQLYRDALATGKPVVLVTDMFLPKALIEKCLRENGIENWADLFVSNEIGLRKDDGKLYQHILEQYAIQPAEMLVVGDNERSDVQIPCDLGASFLHLLRPVELARGLPRFSNIIAQHERAEAVDAELTLGLVVRKQFSPIHWPNFDSDSLIQVTPYNLGYSLVGPLCVSFAQWLVRQAREDNIHRLYFLSREGRLIKQIYDYWTLDQDVPQSDYLIVSRRAVSVAAISTFDDILEIAKTIYFPNTMERFLDTRYGLDLSNEYWDMLAKSLGIERTTIVRVQDRQIEHLVPLFRALETEIIAKAHKERPALLRYLAEHNLDLDSHQAVVDVGYGGTIQSCMNKLLARQVHGYYLMTDERAARVAETHNVMVRGCFLEGVRQSSNAPVMYRYSFELEKLLSSNEPQIGYYELEATGALRAHYRDLSAVEVEAVDLRSQIQKGALDYAQDARRLREKLLPDFQPSCWTARMLIDAFLTQRSQREIELLSHIVLDDHYCGRGLVI